MNQPHQASKGLEPAALAEARARAYGLFGELLGKGLTRENAPAVAALPEFEVGLGRWRSPSGALDWEAAAAAHYDLFGLQVFPVAGAFLDPDGSVGGPLTERAATALRVLGLPMRFADAGPEHLTGLLDGLGQLSAQEATAYGEARPGEARERRSGAQSLIRAHILPWWAPFEVAVRRQGEDSLFAALTKLIRWLVWDHLQDDERTVALTVDWSGPALPELLQRSDVGLKKLAEHLIRPVACGAHLSRSSLSAVGRRAQVPSGFGSRRDQMDTLLGSAVQMDRWRTLMEALALEVRGQLRLLDELPVALATPWRTRLRKTSAGLDAMAMSGEL